MAKGDSSNVASTSSELSSDQLSTFEELSWVNPLLWMSHSFLEKCLLVNLLHQNYPILFLIVVI